MVQTLCASLTWANSQVHRGKQESLLPYSCILGVLNSAEAHLIPQKLDALLQRSVDLDLTQMSVSPVLVVADYSKLNEEGFEHSPAQVQGAWSVLQCQSEAWLHLPISMLPRHASTRQPESAHGHEEQHHICAMHR